MSYTNLSLYGGLHLFFPSNVLHKFFVVFLNKFEFVMTSKPSHFQISIKVGLVIIHAPSCLVHENIQFAHKLGGPWARLTRCQERKGIHLLQGILA